MPLPATPSSFHPNNTNSGYQSETKNFAKGREATGVAGQRGYSVFSDVNESLRLLKAPEGAGMTDENGPIIAIFKKYCDAKTKTVGYSEVVLMLNHHRLHDKSVFNEKRDCKVCRQICH